MIEELQRRNFAATTIRTYLHGVEHFSRYFHRRPDQLGPEGRLERSRCGGGRFRVRLNQLLRLPG